MLCKLYINKSPPLPAVSVSGRGPGLGPSANVKYRLAGLREPAERTYRGVPAAKGVLLVEDATGALGAVCASAATGAAEARAACRGLGWSGWAGAEAFQFDVEVLGKTNWPRELPELHVAWSTLNCTGAGESLEGCAHLASNWQAWSNGTIPEVCPDKQVLVVSCAQDPGALGRAAGRTAGAVERSPLEPRVHSSVTCTAARCPAGCFHRS